MAVRVAQRPRAFLRVSGPDAAGYLERMLSNEVETLPPGGSCEALLLNAKARVVALATVWRCGNDDFLLLTEPESGERLRAELIRSRFAARVTIELEDHVSLVVIGEEAPAGTIPSHDYGVAAYEAIDAPPPPTAETIDAAELELLRIQARTPRMGSEIDDRVLPAEAGLDERAISFTKGCYPGQEPVARLHYRGHVNRRLRLLGVDGDVLPGAEVTHDDKVVGRVTSVTRGHALAYVRVEVPEDAHLSIGVVRAQQLDG